MPVFRPDQLRQEAKDDPNDPCGPYRALLLSDTGGLTQFGAFIEILPPGSASSIKHWHATEDELVYVLQGQVTLIEGDATLTLQPGDTATFKAGTPLGHCLRNDSTAEVRYMVIGTRSTGDTVTYPDHDRVLRFTRPPMQRQWTDLTGNPADSPYARPTTAGKKPGAS